MKKKTSSKGRGLKGRGKKNTSSSKRRSKPSLRGVVCVKKGKKIDCKPARGTAGLRGTKGRSSAKRKGGARKKKASGLRGNIRSIGAVTCSRSGNAYSCRKAR